MAWTIIPPPETPIGEEYVASFLPEKGYVVQAQITNDDDQTIALSMKPGTGMSGGEQKWPLGKTRKSKNENEDWTLLIYLPAPAEAPTVANGRKKPVTMSSSGGGGDQGRTRMLGGKLTVLPGKKWPTILIKKLWKKK